MHMDRQAAPQRTRFRDRFKALRLKAIATIRPRMKLEREPLMSADSFFRAQEPYDSKTGSLKLMTATHKAAARSWFSDIFYTLLASISMAGRLTETKAYDNEGLLSMKMPERVAIAKNELNVDRAARIMGRFFSIYSSAFTLVAAIETYALVKLDSIIVKGVLTSATDFISKHPAITWPIAISVALEILGVRHLYIRVRDRHKNAMKRAANIMIITQYLNYQKKASEVTLLKLMAGDWKSLIGKNESTMIERKASLFATNGNGDPKKLETAKAKTIASFLNTNGGLLFIGVQDDGKVVGIEGDYALLGGKGNHDAFLLKLSQIVDNQIGREFHQYIVAFIEKIDGKDVAIVHVRPSDMPAFVKEDGKETFYTRTAHGSSPLSGAQIATHISGKWPYL